MLETDVRVKRMNAKVKSLSKINIDQAVKDIMDLHAKVPSRHSLSRLAQDAMHTSADRSRVAHIKMEYNRELIKLRHLSESLEKYLRSKYTNFLNNYNAPTQAALVANAIAPIHRRISNLNIIVSTADTALEDYDKIGWTNTTIVNSMKLKDHP